jgi:hypothetical protein
VKARLAEPILTDRIPDTRDIVPVSIAGQCGLLRHVLSAAQLDRRTHALCNLETVSREVSDAIAGLDSHGSGAPVE